MFASAFAEAQILSCLKTSGYTNVDGWAINFAVHALAISDQAMMCASAVVREYVRACAFKCEGGRFDRH